MDPVASAPWVCVTVLFSPSWSDAAVLPDEPFIWVWVAELPLPTWTATALFIEPA